MVKKILKSKIIKIIIVLSISIVGGIYTILVMKYNPEEYSFFIPCIIHELTGINCPGCGLTRAAHYILNGNIKKGLSYNIMIIPLIIVLCYTGYRYLVHILKKEDVMNKILEILLVCLVIMFILFGIIRNIVPYFKI